MPDPTPTPTDSPPLEPTQTPVNDPAPPVPPTPAPAPPPAAKIVLEGTKTERELALERDVKERETRIACLEDENSQLKSIPRSPAPPAPKKKAGGWTFFDAED